MDGPAAIWYDARIDDNMTDDFDAVTDAMRRHFRRESYKAYSYIPKQDNKSVTEFYDELLKIGVAQCWPADKQLDLFRTGIADWYKLSLDARCPKTLTEAYNIALNVEADKMENVKMEERNEKMIQMLMETVMELNAMQQAINEKHENDMTIATHETIRTLNNDDKRLQILENSVTQMSEILFNMQNNQPMMVNQNCLTQQAYPWDYSPHCPRPAEPFNEMPQNLNNPSQKFYPWNNEPFYRHPFQDQKQAQGNLKLNQEN